MEFNGDKLRNLHIFANHIETDIPSPDDSGVIYFTEGVHEPEDGQEGFVISSDTRVYLAPGAVVKGTLICDNVENVCIGGRGIDGVTLRNIVCADIPDLHPSSIKGNDIDDSLPQTAVHRGDRRVCHEFRKGGRT